MMNTTTVSSSRQHEIVRNCLDSPRFIAEKEVVERKDGHEVMLSERIFQYSEDNLARLMFPVESGNLKKNSIIALVLLYDAESDAVIQGNHIWAEPNFGRLAVAIRSLSVDADPRFFHISQKEIFLFHEFTRAIWQLVLDEEHTFGNIQCEEHFSGIRGNISKGAMNEIASEFYLKNFWQGMNALFGMGGLHNLPVSYS